MHSLRTYLSVSLLLLSSYTLFASEAEELWDKANAMKREAAELAERGHMEEAKKLGKEAAILFKKVEAIKKDQKDPRWNEIEGIKKRMHQLMIEEKEIGDRDDAKPRLREIRGEREELERFIHEIMADIKRSEGKHPEQPHHEQPHHPEHADGAEHTDGPHRHHEEIRHHEEMMHRLENMRIAVDHLHQAGLHDVAEHVAQRAEATEKELHGFRMEQERREHGEHPEAQEHDDPIHHVMRQLEEMRHEIGRLHEEINHLRNR